VKTFVDRLHGRTSKTNNHAVAVTAKAEIRAHLLDAIGAGEAAVFDAFAGEGELYQRVWKRARTYVGCDLSWYRDDRLLYVSDNLRVMRAIDLGAYNVFDFDSWGSPWSHAIVLAARRKVRPGERIAVALTEGSGITFAMGEIPRALAQLAGVTRNWKGSKGARKRVAGATAAGEFILERALQEFLRRMNCRIVKRWQARMTKGSRMVYIGLVLEGLPAAMLGDAEAVQETQAAA
jgi:hypothetical protein